MSSDPDVQENIPRQEAQRSVGTSTPELKTLRNWVTERKDPGEKGAREVISQAMQRDLARDAKAKPLEENQVLGKVKKQTSELAERMDGAGTDSLSIERYDRQTGERYTVVARRDSGGFWVVGERAGGEDEDGQFFSMARIGPSGSTELTLQYGERYAKRDANPNVDADSRYQETTTIVFNYLAGEVLKKHPLGEIERQKIRQRKGEVISAIKEGKDEEGRVLYDAYKNALSDPEKALGDIAITYQKALLSKENLGRSGEVNKLVSTLDSLYKQNGESGYKPEVDVSAALEGISDENERKRITAEAIQERAVKDLDGFADKFAAKRVESYAEAKAKFLVREEQTRQIIGKENLDRAEVRFASFRLAASRMELFRVIGKDAGKIGNEQLEATLRDQLEGKWSYGEKEQKQLSEEEKPKLINDAKEKYIQELFAKGENRYGNILADRFDQEESNQAFGPIVEIDNEIAGKRENLQEAINAKPDEICGIVSEVRQLKLQRKAEVANVRVRMAEKRVNGADERWAKVRDEAAEKVSRYGLKGAREVGRQFIAAGKEWLASRANKLKEQFRREMEPVVSRITESVAETKEATVKVLNEMDTVFLGSMRDAGKGVVETSRDAISSVRERALRIENDFERGKIAVEEKLRVTRHGADLWLREKQAEIFVSTRAYKWESWMWVGDRIGGEAIKERNKSRAERIRKVSEADFQRRAERIRNTDNPYLKKFQDDLEKRVKIIGTVTKANEVEAPIASKETTQKQLTEMTQEELSEENEKRRVRFTEVSEKFATVRSDQNSESVMNAGRRYIKTLAESNSNDRIRFGLTPEQNQKIDADGEVKQLDVNLDGMLNRINTTYNDPGELSEYVRHYEGLLTRKKDRIKRLL